MKDKTSTQKANQLFGTLQELITNQRSSVFFKILKILILLSFLSPFLYSTPDLTIVGFIKPEDGLGKVPINIIETLGKDISVNIIHTVKFDLYQGVPLHVMTALNNSDTSPGKVALLTDCVWHLGTSPSAAVPQQSIVKLAYSMHESTHIPKMWVKNLNEQFDAVIVPDPFLKEVYKNSGVNIPIFVLPIPMMLEPYFAHPVHLNFPSTPFVFGDLSANKNPSVLLKAFARVFGKNPTVHLILRAGNLSPQTQEIVNQIIDQYALTNVTIEKGHLSLKEYIDCLSSLDCFVNLSKGEGFSFIPREALTLGVPVIISNNTASTTICNSGFVRAVPSNLKVDSPHLYTVLFNDTCGKQFNCRVKDVAVALLDVYKHYGKYIKKARKGRKWVAQYDCANPELQKAYRTLIKPKQVRLGNKNTIENETIITNSAELYQKYLQLMQVQTNVL